MHRPLPIVALGLLIGSLSTGGVAHAVTTADGSPLPTPPEAAEPSSLATFEGGWLDLSVDWGEATACHVTHGGTRCYRSEAEMDQAEFLTLASAVGGSASGVPTARLVLTCSTTLRLYRSASYAGGVVAFDTRGTVFNLSTYGFDNDTSSYKVGACSSTFWENANALGSTYPGLTVANVSSPSMVAGWDNRISSIAIS